MASKEPKFIVTFKYAIPNGELRSKSLLVSASDTEAAKKKVSDQLTLQYDWHRIGTITPA